MMAADDVSPAAIVKQMMERKHESRLLYVAAELSLADLLKDGPRSSAELANSAGADPDALYRVVRGLVDLGVFARTEEGRFSLAPLGACLCSDAPDSVRAYVRWNGHPMWLQAWASLIHTVRTGETAFNHALGTDFYAYLTAHPDVGAIFDGGMAAVTADTDAAAILAACDFSPTSSIVDVGGGNGALLAAILAACPRAHGRILDQPHAREGALRTIAEAGLDERCQFVAGDFFAAVPAAADAYILKWILHNWDDSRSVAILRSCRRAIAPGARLLVIEDVLPADGELTRQAVIDDITMLAMLGSRERTASEYRALFAQAGFQLSRIVPTTGASSVVEALPI